ncbi:sialate O-acetylesterase [Algoriphagus sp.]|uniref:sialate O-acetylesterase n=1 Tax=Algoriphagus sp. TaxID=1872435 RepID=UPI0025CC6CDE|nr:sialate O-acetylesterase [Algoriphagus sp.]
MKLNRILLFFFSLLLFGSCNEKGKSLTDKDSKKAKEKFHLYILMGQSNMAGRGKVQSIDTLVHPRVYMLDKEQNWVLAKDPMHFDKPVAGVGLGLTFGKIMANENSEIKIGLIPTAVGGSSINAWFADSIHSQTNSYPYNDMIKRANKALAEGTLKGILWHQGESDTRTETDVKEYPAKFNAMIDSLKADLSIATVPIVMGELGHFFYPKSPNAENLNTVFEEMAKSNPCLALVSANGLNHKGDSTHFDSDSYHALGARYAAKMIELQKSCSMEVEK